MTRRRPGSGPGTDAAVSPPSSTGSRHSTGRDAFAECCAAARAAIAGATVDCSRFELRVLLAVLSLTALYSRLEDRVALVQVAAIAYGIPVDSVQGFQRDRTAKALRSLAQRGVLEYEPGTGRHALATLRLPETRHEGYRVEAETQVDSVAETQVDSVAKPSTLGGHSEKVSEKVSEERARSLLALLSKKCKRADPDEWSGLIAQQVSRGIPLTDVLDTIEATSATGAVWPSEFKPALQALRAPRQVELDDNVFGNLQVPPDPNCPRCGGKGWYEHLIADPLGGRERVTHPTCDCGSDARERARLRAVEAAA